MKNVLCLAVHPDDETLGCGGTLLKHQSVGDDISLIIATEMTVELGYSRDQIEQRDTEISKITEFYSFSRVEKLGIPTTCVDSIQQRQLVEKISFAINTLSPEVVYVPFFRDAHSDHRYIFDGISSCFKTFRYPSIKRILMMEVLSETEYSFPTENGFIPNYYVDITQFIDKKIEAMAIYKSEYKFSPFPRSENVIKSLASYRGSFINVEYAEAFRLIKDIW